MSDQAQQQPVVIRIPGPRVRLAEHESLREEMLESIGEGSVSIVLNFEEVEFADSSFLGLLIIVLKRATANGGDVRICRLQPPLAKIFELMRLHRLFQIYETEQEAVESFQ